MLKAGSLENGVAAARPDQIYNWPGLTRIRGEEVLAAASERKYHNDPVGRTVVIRSTDGGKTWGLPQEVYNSELDDRDTNLLTMPDGTIVLTSFTVTDTLGWSAPIALHYTHPEPWRSTWQARAERQGITGKTGSTGWLMRSEDGGRTWSRTVPTPVGQHAGPGVCSDGRLIYIGPGGAEGSAPVFESRDKGDTWVQISQVPAPLADDPPHPMINENHLIEVRPGHLLAMFRSDFYDPKKIVLYQSDSFDGGRTWSQVKPLPILGHPPFLTLLSSGAILCTYGYREYVPGRSIRAVLSYDEGRSWDVQNMIMLYEFDRLCDMGYPVSVEVSPGEILTVYYANYKESPAVPGSGSTAWIMHPYLEDAGGMLYTRWRLS